MLVNVFIKYIHLVFSQDIFKKKCILSSLLSSNQGCIQMIINQSQTPGGHTLSRGLQTLLAATKKLYICM